MYFCKGKVRVLKYWGSAEVAGNERRGWKDEIRAKNAGELVLFVI